MNRGAISQLSKFTLGFDALEKCDQMAREVDQLREIHKRRIDELTDSCTVKDGRIALLEEELKMARESVEETYSVFAAAMDKLPFKHQRMA